VSEADQANFLLEAFHCLQEDPYVELALWFNNIDISAADGELNRYGLKRSDGSPKPAYAAFKSFAQGGDKLTGPCGDFVKPSIAIRAPGPGKRVFDRLVVAASTPDTDVARMSFFVDGREIENFTPKAPASTRDYAKEPLLRDWQGVRKLPFGAHKLRITAVDTSGNEAAVEMPFERVDPATLPPQKTVFQRVKLAGSKRVRTFTGKLASPGLDFAIRGKVQVVWQAKRRGAWKKIHGGAKNANELFRFKQKLRFKGRWRVRAEYKGPRPYKKAATPWRTFKVR